MVVWSMAAELNEVLEPQGWHFRKAETQVETPARPKSRTALPGLVDSALSYFKGVFGAQTPGICYECVPLPGKAAEKVAYAGGPCIIANPGAGNGNARAIYYSISAVIFGQEGKGKEDTVKFQTGVSGRWVTLRFMTFYKLLHGSFIEPKITPNNENQRGIEERI